MRMSSLSLITRSWRRTSLTLWGKSKCNLNLVRTQRLSRCRLFWRFLSLQESSQADSMPKNKREGLLATTRTTFAANITLHSKKMSMWGRNWSLRRLLFETSLTHSRLTFRLIKLGFSGSLDQRFLWAPCPLDLLNLSGRPSSKRSSPAT